ncbi:DUF4380 domain-containing protein [Mycolicibacterium goodii]|uniref:DUF4380 domain-containing protein n=1 Tax=Mycolicibacterium goodii TaxID=134601 RepID=A0A0K0X8V5_MYCGD|nr:hypothetical protein AFA91_19970 [Mycolicibacterium goodii]
MTVTTPQVWVTRGHHDVHWIQTGSLTLGVVPALGGRLLSLRLDGNELLWRNPALLGDDLQPVDGHIPAPVSGSLGDWCNYGGDKTWPAPQGWSAPQQWAGPPDPVLDSGHYAIDVRTREASAELAVTSPPDPRTGLQISRTFTVGADSEFTLRLSAANITDHAVTWALWNVTQLPGGGTVEVDVDHRFTAPVELVSGTGVPSWRRSGPTTITIEPQDVVGKLGFPHATGSLRYRRDNVSLTWDFPVDDNASYPDDGSRAEVWMEHPQPAPLAALDGLDPPDRIVECEVLSPSHTLAPGGSMSLAVKVGVHASYRGGQR